ncbi:hypothetical protein ACK3SF_03020 [Candidatus Nanosalina sp. VS9-1]|uniref:hypothetical protein n=1 Tax=Candidatus Nanosalina sp. VS9-1 TaxID=3388566 RepID=UPI0039E090D8
MDKVLTLIVAASVLMIAALTLIFSTNDALGSFGDTADADSRICPILESDFQDEKDDGSTAAARNILGEAARNDCSWVDDAEIEMPDGEVIDTSPSGCPSQWVAVC